MATRSLPNDRGRRCHALAGDHTLSLGDRIRPEHSVPATARRIRLSETVVCVKADTTGMLTHLKRSAPLGVTVGHREATEAAWQPEFRRLMFLFRSAGTNGCNYRSNASNYKFHRPQWRSPASKRAPTPIYRYHPGVPGRSPQGIQRLTFAFGPSLDSARRHRRWAPIQWERYTRNGRLPGNAIGTTTRGGDSLKQRWFHNHSSNNRHGHP